jgi:hypothetical protein
MTDDSYYPADAEDRSEDQQQVVAFGGEHA